MTPDAPSDRPDPRQVPHTPDRAHSPLPDKAPSPQQPPQAPLGG
jgi:hypothetical protein